MKVKVKLFSLARELAGFSEQTLDLGDRPQADSVLEYLSRHDPRFQEWRQAIRFAVNQHYVPGNHPLKEGDEVAVIPPVSGG